MTARAAVLYGSSRGNTRKVVARLPEQLHFAVDVLDVAERPEPAALAPYSVLLFFASTWGDGELQKDMEAFLAGRALSLQGKRYAICELGNYYGYDDYEFGAMRIIRHHLEAAGGQELIEPFSMDSLPRKDWDGLARWCALLNAAMEPR
ncbi:flavodoxin domain-containing protein [Methylogaea oryzae]|uniref:Flavodoxin n=1 Tax=Methylogaea oryzae TaxID=1295382 RepID=A0A8D5AMZ3_9GAMM|nr:flavodoxin domain-containing protein [Methylogaea oryzae]BBL71580.1 flavodoxin [Methylogaea oryzae]